MDRDEVFVFLGLFGAIGIGTHIASLAVTTLNTSLSVRFFILLRLHITSQEAIQVELIRGTI